MKKQYDFSKGERGKFYKPDAELSIPIYLEADVAEFIQDRARKSAASIDTIVNALLRKEIRDGTATRKG